MVQWLAELFPDMNAAHFGLTVILLLGLLLLLVGVGLLWAPKSIQKLSHRLNVSYDPSNLLRKVIDKEISSDRWILGNRHVLGVIALLISGILLGYYLLSHR